MHGTQIGVISINSSVLACGDHSVDDCPGLLHESLSIVADQRMNAGLDMIGLPGSTNFGLWNRFNPVTGLRRVPFRTFSTPLEDCVQRVELTVGNDDEAVWW